MCCFHFLFQQLWGQNNWLLVITNKSIIAWKIHGNRKTEAILNLDIWNNSGQMEPFFSKQFLSHNHFYVFHDLSRNLITFLIFLPSTVIIHFLLWGISLRFPEPGIWEIRANKEILFWFLDYCLAIEIQISNSYFKNIYFNFSLLNKKNLAFLGVHSTYFKFKLK